MTDQAAAALLITLLVIAGVIIIAALILRWAVSGNWYSVAGTEIERDIWEAARREKSK